MRDGESLRAAGLLASLLLVLALAGACTQETEEAAPETPQISMGDGVDNWIRVEDFALELDEQRRVRLILGYLQRNKAHSRVQPGPVQQA